jgi:YesN/AraC family two-component response regulator
MKTISIIKAEYAGNLSVKVLFNDKTTNTIDVGTFIRKHPHPQYNKYLEEKNFKKFKIDNGNIIWGSNWDLIFPLDQLYKGEIA